MDWVKDMREIEGQSLRMIVERLEKQEVPTKLKYERWHPETVRRIFRDNYC